MGGQHTAWATHGVSDTRYNIQCGRHKVWATHSVGSGLKFSSVRFFCLFGVKLRPDQFTIKGNNPQNQTELPKTTFLQFKTSLNQLLTAYYNKLWSITIITCYNHLFVIFSCLLLTKCTNNQANWPRNE